MAVKKHSDGGQIGFYEWNLDAMIDMEKVLRKFFVQACKIASKEPIYASVSINYDKKTKPKDITKIYVSLPLGEYQMDGLDYHFTYEEVIHDFIKNNYFRSGTDETEIKHANALAVRLRKLADDLDKAVNEKHG
jgi:hypothetical protein